MADGAQTQRVKVIPAACLCVTARHSFKAGSRLPGTALRGSSDSWNDAPCAGSVMTFRLCIFTLVGQFGSGTLCANWSNPGQRQHRDAILATLSLSNHHLTLLELDVVHAHPRGTHASLDFRRAHIPGTTQAVNADLSVGTPDLGMVSTDTISGRHECNGAACEGSNR